MAAPDRSLQRLFADLPPDKQSALGDLVRAHPEPIAIVGMGCRFPGGSSTPDAFWELLRDGVDAVTEMPAERRKLSLPGVEWDAIDQSAGPPRAGLLGEVEGFDAAFFGIAAAEARCTDPQHRLLLEVAWEALEDAGIPPSTLAGGDAGVFVGIAQMDYAAAQYGNLGLAEFRSITGSAHNFGANRISYALDLRGPSVALDTACSSSLVSIHLACESLRSHECSVALAGGVNLILGPSTHAMLAQGGALAPDGLCKAFDHRADGFVRGEGCGMLVLKRLRDARRDGDRILARVRGSAVNQDGRTNVISAPRGPAQESVIRRALEHAALEPDQIDYVETHGTGTALGDPIEIEALASVFSHRETQPCRLGAVKTNIGHLEAASGVASVIKVVLALGNECVPRNLHFEGLNPQIEFPPEGLELATWSTPWPRGDRVRRAGVSAFGIGGTNAHVVIEEAPDAGGERAERETEPRLLLPLSARSEPALRELAARYASLLDPERDARPLAPAVCRAAALHRDHHAHRASIAGDSAGALVEGLLAVVDGRTPPGTSRGTCFPGSRRGLVYLFPGQGGQWAGMARQLLEREPAFRDSLEATAEAMRERADWSLIDVIEGRDPRRSELGALGVIQPCLFAYQVGLASLLSSWGVEPDAVVGHSMGEIAAAVVAGGLSLSDGARLICERARVVERAAGAGTMALVELSLEDAEKAVEPRRDRVSVAAWNGPRSSVLSGTPEAIDATLGELESAGVFGRRIQVDFASHSPQMDPLLPELRARVAGIAPEKPRVQMVSTVTGKAVEGATLQADYWADNLRLPVRLWEVVRSLAERGPTTFVELSPHPVLTGALRDGLAELSPDHTAVGTVVRDESERVALMATLGRLYCDGRAPEWQSLFPDDVERVALPTYPWQRQPFWLGPGAGGRGRRVSRAGRRAAEHPLLGQPVCVADAPLERRVWEQEISAAAFPYLADHRVNGAIIVLGVVYLEMAIAGAEAALGRRPTGLAGVEFRRALFLAEEAPRRVQLIIDPIDSDRVRFRVYSGPAEDAPRAGWTLHAEGEVSCSEIDEPETDAAALAQRGERCDVSVAPQEYYAAMDRAGAQYGPLLQGIRTLRFARRSRRTVAEVELCVELADELDAYRFHPALLDAAAQAFLAPFAVDESVDELYLPLGIDRVLLRRPLGARLTSHSQVREVRDAGFVGDVGLLDEAGRVAVEFRGLRVESVAHSVLRGSQRPVDDWFYDLEWRAEPLPPGRAEPRGEGWLVLADQGGVARALAEALRTEGERVLLAARNAGVIEVEQSDGEVEPDAPVDDEALLVGAGSFLGEHWRGVVDCRALDAELAEDGVEDGGDAADRVAGVFESATRLAQALVRREPEAGARALAHSLVLVTRGAVPAGAEGDGAAVQAAPLVGLRNAIALERPELDCRLLDLDPQRPADAAARLGRELQSGAREDLVAWRGGERRIARLARRPLAPADAEAIAGRVSRDGSVLISGGLGALGLATATWLAERGVRSLVLAGRTADPARAASAVEALGERGASATVIAADVSDPAAVSALVERIDRELPPLRGVVHAAGLLEDATLAGITPEQVRRVFAAKVAGAWNLHLHTLERPLDFFLLYSSGASLLGSPGQAVYAGANAFLDALAHRRRARGLPATAINWGVWAEGGLAAKDQRGQRLGERGIGSMSPAEALAALGRVVSAQPTQIGVMSLDLRRWFHHNPHAAKSTLLETEAEAQRVRVRPEGAGQLREAVLAEGRPQRRAELIEGHLRGVIGEVLGFPPEQIHPQQPLGSLGFDSLSALELRNRLESALGITLSATLIWAHPTLEGLVRHLESKLGAPGASAPEGRPVARLEAPEVDAVAGEVSGLSDEEIGRLLRGGGAGREERDGR